MRVIFTLFSVCMLSLPFPAMADDDPEPTEGIDAEEAALLDDCRWQLSQPEIRDCLKKLAIESAKELVKVEDDILLKIKNSIWGRDGRDYEKRYVRLARENFLKSKAEFIKFRKMFCDFDEALAFGATSSSHPQRQYHCQFRVNYWQTKMLKGFASEIPQYEKK